MTWDNDTLPYLESCVFKGKIVERRKGRGGLIYIVERDGYPKRVAYKTIQEFEQKDNGSELPEKQNIQREAKSWFDFSGHPLVINPFSIEMHKGFPLICMPYCDGDLTDFKTGNLNLVGTVCLALQIVKGMMTANTRGMDHHQDIKPENLLYVDLSKKFNGFPPDIVDPSIKYSVRIADFGVANAWHDGHLGGTNIYKAPEQYDAGRYTAFAPDVFAVGIVIAEILQGHHPAAKDSDTEVRKWRGSKLKKWAISGERHLSGGDEGAAPLIAIVKQMLSPDPSKRPLFNDVYNSLSSILEDLCPQSFQQLRLICDYYDAIADQSSLEGWIERKAKLAAIPEHRDFIKGEIREQLSDSLGCQLSSIELALRVHHLANGLDMIYPDQHTHADKELLAIASGKVIRFFLKNSEEITSEVLWPALRIAGTQTPKTGTDIEAKAELFGTSLDRLVSLGRYDAHLKRIIEGSTGIVRASKLMHEGSKHWRNGNLEEACRKIAEVRELLPDEEGLEELSSLWNRSREIVRI